MRISEIQASEYNDFYKNYIELVSDKYHLIDGFIEGEHNTLTFFKEIPEEKLNYAYAKDKWNIKDIFQHIIDTERVFQYRCFCIARRDKTQLPGYDQDTYVKPALANTKTMEDLMDEFVTVRRSFIALLKSLSEDDLKEVGNANGYPISARAAAFIVLGHALWHIDIIKHRYLKENIKI
ncbi:DinB family protein [Aestuariibaculum sediminum]|uniref:DinB family protein n=1 Tax=Aestuariibaculum sediminum TaxID=2770637 RepID=A0A8J6UG39_9FLAO|nr:DinB family protein [Aestuariibaculum sediminum]MBD0831886.1 DinB family protein [Aestuariibaculum sediminum]